MKKILLSFITIFLSTTLFAATRTAEQAAAIAAQFTNSQPQLSRLHKAPRTASSMRLAHTAKQNGSETPAFYIFNQDDNNGFVIVSADDRTADDVLAYTEKGTFNKNNVNRNLQFWLNRYTDEITVLQTIDDSEFVKPAIKKATQATAIAPLLVNKNGEAITWYQESPYSNKLPMDKYDNTRCLTGCVATAAGQILYKWRYPETGTGSKTYTWNNPYKSSQSETLTANYGETTYDWDNMLPAYEGVNATTAQKNAVATLMLHLGIACDMMYGGDKAGGSGAWTDDMAYGLKTYFKYRFSKFITMYSKNGYRNAKGTAIADVTAEYSVSVTDFVSYYNADLEAGRPILMGGEDTDGGGHEFVCDGRDANGKFHINWGWEGDGNCYVALTALKPTGASYNFSTNIDALIGLEPDVDIDPVAVTGVSVSPTTKTIDKKEKVQLTATVTPADATNKQVSWTSDNTAVATVSSSGLVTGVAQGTAVITATTKDGSFTASATITVTNNEAAVISCDPYSYTFDGVYWSSTNLGDYYWYISYGANTSTGVDSNNGAQYGSAKTPAKYVYFETDNTKDCLLDNIVVNASVAKDGDGTLAVFIGETQIGSTQSLSTDPMEYTFTNTAKLQGKLEIQLNNTIKAMYIKYIKTNVTETPVTPVSVTGVTVDPASATIKVGQTTTLTANVKPLSATNKNVSWSTSDEKVATVNNEGLVTGVAAGKAFITVTTEDNNFTDVATITVTENTVPDDDVNEAFVHLTDIAKLSAGDKILLVYDAKPVAAGELLSKNGNIFLTTVDINIIDNKAYVLENTYPVIMTVGGEAGAWTFANENGELLGATAKNKLGWNVGHSTWTISIVSGDATITNESEDFGRFLYNVQYPRFLNYGTSTSVGTNMKLPQIYYKKGGSTPSAIDNVSQKQKATKRIINGQLVIIVEDIQYNAQGQRIN